MARALPARALELSRIIRLLHQTARSFYDKPALIAAGRTVNYAEVIDRVLRLADWLSRNAPVGARAVICMRNGTDAALLPLALRAAGLVSVPVNWRMSPLELGNVVSASDAALLLHDVASARVVEETLRNVRAPTDCRALGLDDFDQLDASSLTALAERSRAEAEENALASIHFTSGTLGAPKGVMQSHLNWDAVWRNLMSVRDFRRSDTVALMGPLSHAAGTYVVPLLLSGATILLPEDANPDSLAAELTAHQVTVLQCVPTLLTRLVNSGTFREAARGQLRLIVYGAESIPYSTLRSAIESFGPILAQNYGLTEAMMTCATLPPDEHVIRGAGRTVELRHGVLGRPYPFVELVVRLEDGRPVEDGETGEITVRSPHVMLGYWRNASATSEVLRDGWLWTGDLARWTQDGYLAIAGRRKDMIISGGMNIYPAEVQAFISRMAGVRECAAFGVPSAEWGEELVTVVALDGEDGAKTEALRARARKDLGIRTPKKWIVVPEMPRTANGKIDFSALRAMVASQAGTA